MFRRRSSRPGAILVLIASLIVSACSVGQSNSGGGGGKKPVHVLATWGGSEQESFLAMVKPFEDRTGIKVEYEGTRDLNAVLKTRVSAGTPPELAGLPGPGQMAEFAKAGKLVSLDNVLDMTQMKDQYASDWLKLGQVDGKSYSIFIKTALKGLVWYDPKNFKAKGYQPPTSFDQMVQLAQKIKTDGTAPFCIGLESGAASGWPGSDWIKEIVLLQSGPQVYDNWVAGKQKWTSPEIKQAFQTFGTVTNTPGLVYGGKDYMLSTAFGDAANPMFQNPPKCYMHNQGSFMTDFFIKGNASLKANEDFTFFNLPDVNPQYSGAHVVAGDLFGMFKETDEAKQLIKYLATPEAQSIWVKRGGAISPNKKVALSDYPDDLSRQIGQTLTTAKIARFDAADLMPNAMQSAYFKSVVDYVSNPGQLDSILATLDKVQADSYK